MCIRDRHCIQSIQVNLAHLRVHFWAFLFLIYFNLSNNNGFLRHMYTIMFSQAPFMFESFSAIIALESLLISVRYFVALQMTCWNKTAGAVVTFVWLFSSVFSPHVHCQIASCDAWKITLSTFVRLYPRVHHFVQPHSYQCNWRIFTLAALVRLHTSVYHNVFS